MKDWQPTPAPRSAQAQKQWVSDNMQSLNEFAQELKDDEVFPLIAVAKKEVIQRFGCDLDDLMLLEKLLCLYAQFASRDMRIVDDVYYAEHIAANFIALEPQQRGGRRKLKKGDHERMRKLSADGVDAPTLADMFKVTPRHVRRIVNGK